MKFDNSRLLSWIFPVLCLWFVAAGFMFPMTQDEAYYFQWGLHPAAGYFDHPPGVAWLSALGRMTGADWLHGRAATIALTLFGFFILSRLYRLIFPSNPAIYATALTLGTGNAAALVSGFLTTPDSVLLFAWILALHEAARALKGQRWRWLTAGAVTGLGLLGKFTMLLIGPVFLWALLRDKTKTLRTPWPWLGGFVCLLVMSPGLIWNADHEWITWKFQLRHGFALERPGTSSGHLPGASLPGPDSEGQRLANWYRVPDVSGLIPEEEAFPDFRPKGVLDKFLEAVKSMSQGTTLVKRLTDYAGGQLALWGLLLIPLLSGFLIRLTGRSRGRRPFHEGSPDLKPLIHAAALVPLAVFALVAMKGKVEANWPAMYLVGAAPFIAAMIRPRLKYLIGASVLNLALLSLVITYTLKPWVRVNPGLDRILMETHGYQKLGDFLAERSRELSGIPVYGDSYQLVSMLRYYQPHLPVTQWPGITRPSEFVLNRAFAPRSFEELLKEGSFLLISSEEVPPDIPEFSPKDLIKITDCREGFLKFQDSWLGFDKRMCGPIHRWYLTFYQKSSGTGGSQHTELADFSGKAAYWPH